MHYSRVYNMPLDGEKGVEKSFVVIFVVAVV